MEFSGKAIVLKGFGSYDCLSIDKYPLDSLQDNVEVKVSLCGLNFADLYTRQGLFYDRQPPFVLGIECVGVITAIGKGTETALTKGQRVICYNYHGGLFRDVIRVHPSYLYPIPDDISNKTAASLFVNYLTAYFTLFEMGNFKEGQTLFIQSCAGGVGLAVTQLARTLRNVTVIGSSSETKHNEILKHGVHHVIDYTDTVRKLKEISPNGIDLIIDNQCGSIFADLQDLLKPLGRIVSIGANELIKDHKRVTALNALKLWWNTKHIPVLSLIESNRAVAGFHLGVLARQESEKVRQVLEIIYSWAKIRKIEPKIDSIWAFEDIIEATKVLGERRNIGKVLLRVDKQ